MLPDVARAEVNVDRIPYVIYLGCKREIDTLIFEKWLSIYDLNLKVALLEKRLDTPVLEHLLKPVKN